MNAQKNVKVKLEIKGASKFKLEFEGPLDKATQLAIDALQDLRKRLFAYEET